LLTLNLLKLGPTGKSVTRSYYTSLDMLVPRKSDISTVDLGGGSSQNANSQEDKYALAMEYLRNAASGSASNTNYNVQGSKDALVKRGVPASLLSVYVEKQMKWAEARAKWDAVQNEAIGEEFEFEPS
jgi:hypothetical protein